jgi:hypothetical protein
MDVSNIPLKTLETIVEFETEPERNYYTNKDVFENDGAYAEDEKD